MHVIFWASAIGLFYIYLGYPLLAWLLARLRPQPISRSEVQGSAALVIAAYNEGPRLEEKLRGLRLLPDYARVAEILIGSDGSTDDTAERVAALADPKVRVHAFPVRRGKPAVLNDLMAGCAADNVVMMDARQWVGEGAILHLLENFADPRVGAVSGELILEAEGGGALGVDAYWRYEKFIRRCESARASVPGATGACYALRRSLFRPLDPDTILDDVVIPMRAVAAGYRCVFDGRAQVFDRLSRDLAQEGVRKRRTIAGAIQLLWLDPGWLLPWRNPIWFAYVSHKIARLISPFLLVLLAAACVTLAGRSWAVTGAGGMLVALVALALVHGASRGRLGGRAGSASAAFLALNGSTLAAWWDALRGRYRVTWERAADGARTRRL